MCEVRNGSINGTPSDLRVYRQIFQKKRKLSILLFQRSLISRTYGLHHGNPEKLEEREPVIPDELGSSQKLVSRVQEDVRIRKAIFWEVRP